MKCTTVILKGCAICVSLLLFGLQLGCETTGSSTQKMVGPVSGPIIPDVTDTTYSRGDTIILEFEPPAVQTPWQQVITEDGSIRLPMNKSIIAAGKKKAQLEQEIQEIYVPKILRRVTVNIRSADRSYFVRGEVRLPGQKSHTGLITATKAIAAAGDFTDFAKRSDVEIIRANGQKIHMNADKALRDPSKDVPVFPNDIVVVHRRFF